MMNSADDFINDREVMYGSAVNNWVDTAKIWSGILGYDVQPWQAVLCMMGMKLQRARMVPDYEDNIKDVEGYAEIFRRILGPDMIHAQTAAEYLEKKGEFNA